MRKIFLGLLAFAMLFSMCGASDFSEEKSTHFIVYYKDIPEDFVKQVLEYSERYYESLTEKLGFQRFNYWTWDDRARIYIYPDKETFESETKQPGWAGGLASYEAKTIWTFPQEAGFFDTLLPHEIGHIVFREVVGKRRSVPLWLEEGVAMYLEEAKRIGSDRAVLKAFKSGTFIPFEELNRVNAYTLRSGIDVQLFYAESSCLVNFLIQKFDVDAFNTFCSKLKDGKNLDDALSYAYFYLRDSEALGDAWEKYLQDKLKTETK